MGLDDAERKADERRKKGLMRDLKKLKLKYPEVVDVLEQIVESIKSIEADIEDLKYSIWHED